MIGGGELETRALRPWLVRLRWVAVVGQFAVAAFLQHGDLPLWLGAAGLTLISNLWLARAPDRHAGRARELAVVLLLDVAILTLLLGASGGPSNPFTVLYLVHITLAAVVLSPVWTTVVTVAAVAGYATLFVGHLLDTDGHGSHFSQHLQGMWIAFVLAAAAIGYFAGKVTRTIAVQRDQIARLRESAARNARLASLTTLAAGAAHELGNPLGTIALAASELERAAAAGSDHALLLEDARLVLLEVDRCRIILEQMAARAGGEDPIDPGVSCEELERAMQERLAPAQAGRLIVERDESIALIRAPRTPLLQAVSALVKNAFDASDGSAAVRLSVAAQNGVITLEVADRGSGMAEDVLARAGEPFFTTKEPGRGLGLGLFMARAFAESMGGDLRLESAPGSGTRARLTLERIGGAA